MTHTLRRRNEHTATPQRRRTELCGSPVGRRCASSSPTASDRQGASHERERGTSMVETPVAILMLLVLGMGAFWVGNIVTRFHELEDAVHAGARYASRAYAHPDHSGRRRTEPEIVNFTKDAAEPLDRNTMTVTVKCGTDPNGMGPCVGGPQAYPPGTYIEVSASAPVATTDPVLELGRTVNSLIGLLVPGSPEPFPQSITASESSVAVIE